MFTIYCFLQPGYKVAGGQAGGGREGGGGRDGGMEVGREGRMKCGNQWESHQIRV